MSAELWTADELARVLGAPSAPLSRACMGVSIDTRTLVGGDLFVAIKGDTLDGHDHVARAFAAGAVAAIVAHDRAGELSGHGPVFAVADTLRAMEALGQAARSRSNARILAVTGSVGKTSAKEMARTALSSLGPTHASAASYNNHWGVPLTLARLPASAAYAVFEIGMNHSGEITPLVAFVRPHVALITTIAPVHIEYLGSIEAIADAKAEIFSGLAPGSVVVLNRDAPQFDRLATAARSRDLKVRSFGATPGADARLLDCSPDGEGSAVQSIISGTPLDFALRAPGRHMAENALGVLLAVEALGAPLDAAARALENFMPAKGRGERFALQANDGPFTLIDESYNANPASMRAALGLLGATTPGPRGRRIAVIGDMLELGAAGAELHAELTTDLAANGVDLLFGAGPLTRALFDKAEPKVRATWGAGSADIEEALLAAPRAGDVMMIKGSHGSRMEPLVAALRQRYSPARRDSDIQSRRGNEGVSC